MNVFISVNTVLLCLVSICTIVIVWQLKKRKQLHNVTEPAQDRDVILNEVTQSAEQPTVTKPIEAARPEEEKTIFLEEQPSIIINNISIMSFFITMTEMRISKK